MINYKPLASSIVIPSIVVIHLVNGAQFLNDTCLVEATVTVIIPLTKM